MTRDLSALRDTDHVQIINRDLICTTCTIIEVALMRKTISGRRGSSSGEMPHIVVFLYSIQGSPSRCGLLQIPGGASKLKRGTNLLQKITEEKAISHQPDK